MENRPNKIGPIREGAGLEESRYNTEFIELLKKFSTPLLLCIAVIAGGYFLYTYRTRQRELSVDGAWAQFDAAEKSGSPASLLRIADENEGTSIAYLARLKVADVHLDASRTGVPIGVTLEADGAFPKDTQALTKEQEGDELKASEGLYKQVFDQVSNNPELTPFALSALSGLAAVAESKGELEAAKGFYQQIIDRARAAGLDASAKRAEDRMNSVDKLKNAPRLYAQSELPASAVAIQPFTSGMSDIKVKTSTGETLTVGPDGQLKKLDGTPVGPTDTPAATPTTPATGTTPPTPEATPQTPAPAAPGAGQPDQTKPGEPKPEPAKPADQPK